MPSYLKIRLVYINCYINTALCGLGTPCAIVSIHQVI